MIWLIWRKVLTTNYLKNKVVVVTGAASGFGLLVAMKCLKLGAKVSRGDIDSEQLITSTPEKTSPKLLNIKTDVSDLKQMQDLINETVKTFGTVDVMINNAGTMPLAFFEDHRKAKPEWDKCIDTNFKGVLNGIISVYDIMISNGHGHIVNISSIYGNYPVVGAGVYGATKAAVNYISESLRVETQGKIKVTVIKPTGVRGTKLGEGIINDRAIVGILGQNTTPYIKMMEKYDNGELPNNYSDPENIEYYALRPELLADQIIYAINQPFGVSISDLTVRASGEGYIL